MIDWVEPEWPYHDRVRVLTTTRAGGVSSGPYSGFNLADHVGDDPKAVRANRAELDELLGGLPVQWLEQVHGTDIVQVSRKRIARVPTADGAWTNERMLVLAVLTADCLPVVLADRAFRSLAVVHAGWRGLVAGVLAAACAALPERPQIAWIGPAIGAEAYEVGAEVLAAVDALGVGTDDVVRNAAAAGKGHLDLPGLARRLLDREGVVEVYGERYCTHRDPRFYSFRRDGQTGRMATLAWLRS
ncbi:MAG TPA: peptidoglycan editing factor PgeF [Pseudomonadales bacterium]